MKILYFDIDGVLISYDDELRPLLSNGQFEKRIKQLQFDKLVCVSGWSDIFNSGLTKRSETEKKAFVHEILNQIFPDREWFLNKLELAYDTDHRCKHIDLATNWFYVDDWADKFFSEHFGETLYLQQLGNRILLADPHGDGRDILEWLDNIIECGV